MNKKRIYCVDDDEDILMLYKVVLAQAGYEATSLSSGEVALKAIYERNPDLIILDELMSDLSGMEICSRIRRDKNLPYIPIIMVTGVDSKEGKIRSLEEGIDDYILKPFDHEELLAKVLVMLRIKDLYNDLLLARKELIKAERLAAVGQWAAAMAHEIRNPLSVINASIQFIKSKMSQQEEIVRDMDVILRKIAEVDHTIRELLVAAQPLRLKPAAIDLNECIQEVLRFIKDKCEVQKVGLTMKLKPELPQILGDEEHLQRVFLNIFINAMNSMPQGGSLLIATDLGSLDMVKISIKDTGKGISPEDQEHLFEPFFSRQSGGSGLGLYVVKTVVEELKGRIEVKSEVGQGTTFIISLPQITENNIKAMEQIPDTSSQTRK